MLEMLDLHPIPQAQFDLTLADVLALSSAPVPTPATPSPAIFPTGMGPGFFSSGVEQLTAEFLTQFFTLHDTARPSLLPAYTTSSTFSYSINMNTPPRSRMKIFTPKEMKNQRQLNWTPWRKDARNLARVGSLDHSVTTLRVGGADIIKAMEALPGTKHDIAQQSKFLVDAWPMPGVLQGQAQGDVLFISVHGEYHESMSLPHLSLVFISVTDFHVLSSPSYGCTLIRP